MDQSIHRVLIVDDEPLIREATSRAMSAHAFCCETASDGRQAFQMYQKKRHDLVVTDLRMPKHHGHSLILELLKDHEPPSIVVLTGVANSRLVKDLFNRGVQDIVHKPIDFQVFAAKMLAQVERGSWNSSLGQGQKIQQKGSLHPLVYKIETALEIFALCIPPELERELSSHTDLLADPSASLLQFLERLSLKKDKSPDRRKGARIPVLSSAIAIPVNKDFVPQGAATTVTFNDLSESGGCLFNTRAFATEYVALRWRSLISPKVYLKAVMQVKRCKPMGPFYEIAGPFVMHD
ncbi:MAG: response regulator [Planctomycetes bacterium]|nr:response regulator [Planctomycetota bacterium]